MTSSDPNYIQLTLPNFLGTLLNWALFGVLILQVGEESSWTSEGKDSSNLVLGMYYAAFPQDRTVSKILVAFILILETIQTVAGTRDAMRIFSISWGDPAILNEVGWAWFSTPIMDALSATVGQSYFAWRIRILGGSNFVPALVIVLTMVQLGAGFWSGVNICRAKNWLNLQNTNVPAISTWLGATSFCDLVIVAAMVFYLRRSSDPEFTRTRAVVSRIIKITVETGLICALLAIVDSYLFAMYKGTSYHLAICTILSKVYSNSILAILNSRIKLVRQTSKQIVLNVSDIVFQSESAHGIPRDGTPDTRTFESLGVRTQLEGIAEKPQSV